MKNILPLILFFIGYFSQAQYLKNENLTNVIAYWKKGDVLEYEQLEKEFKIKGNDTIVTKNKKFDIKFNVVDQDSTSYIIHWESTPDLSGLPADFQKSITSKLGNSIFKFKTDEYGSFQELLNLDEILNYSKKTFELALDLIPDKNTKKQFKDASELVLGNEDVVTQLIVSKLNTFLFFYGNSLDNTKPNEIEYESVNPITKNKLIYKQSIEVESYDEKEEMYNLYSEIYPKESNLVGEIKSTLETIISKEVKEMDQIQDFGYISKIFQVTHDSGVIVYQLKRDFIHADDQEVIKELEFSLK